MKFRLICAEAKNIGVESEILFFRVQRVKKSGAYSELLNLELDDDAQIVMDALHEVLGLNQIHLFNNALVNVEVLITEYRNKITNLFKV